MTDTATPVNAPPDDFPWAPYRPAPVTYGMLHLIAPAPGLEFGAKTYPSLTIRDAPDTTPHGSFTLSLNGDEAQRRAVAARLREIADRIEAWTESVSLSAIEQYQAESR